MSYYTQYELSAEWYHKPIGTEQDDRIKELEDEIKKMGVFDSESCFDLGWWANTKWYDWEKDMALLSKRFPDFLFLLNGNGEEEDDIWGVYFLNGRIMRDARKIITKPFTVEELTMAEINESNRYSCQEEQK